MKYPTKSKKEPAKELLQRIRKHVAQHPSPIFRMSKEEVIKQMRKTREKLWEEKLAAYS